MTWGCGGRPSNSPNGTSYDWSFKLEAYVGQDLLGLLSKKQSTWGQGEIYQPCKDYVFRESDVHT